MNSSSLVHVHVHSACGSQSKEKMSDESPLLRENEGHQSLRAYPSERYPEAVHVAVKSSENFRQSGQKRAG